MIALLSTLSLHFLTYETFSTIANPILDLVVMSVGMTFVLIIVSLGVLEAARGRRSEHGMKQVGRLPRGETRWIGV